MEEGHWERRAEAGKVEGRQWSGRVEIGWLDGVKRTLAVREVGLQEATHLVRESNVWRELVRASS